MVQCSSPYSSGNRAQQSLSISSATSISHALKISWRVNEKHIQEEHNDGRREGEVCGEAKEGNK